jgi:glutathione S-transferase
MYLYTLTRWLEGHGIDVKRFPKVADHMRRMEEKPQVQKVVAAHKA